MQMEQLEAECYLSSINLEITFIITDQCFLTCGHIQDIWIKGLSSVYHLW